MIKLNYQILDVTIKYGENLKVNKLDRYKSTYKSIINIKIIIEIFNRNKNNRK